MTGMRGVARYETGQGVSRETSLEHDALYGSVPDVWNNALTANGSCFLSLKNRFFSERQL